MASKGAPTKRAGVPQSINAVTGKTAAEKKAAVVTAPAASAPAPTNTEYVRIDTLGERDVTTIREQPVVVEERDRTKLMDFRKVQHTERIQQPVLTIEEALKLGPQNWIPYGRGGVGHYTCVVNFRRFIIGPEVASKLGLRAQGKIIV